MNWLDVAVACVLAAIALRGFLKGLVAESLGFLGLLMAAAAALGAYPWVADPLRGAAGLSRPVAVLAAALAVFLVVEFLWLVALWFLLGRAKRRSFRRSGANRVGGALFGCGKGILLVSLLLLVLEVLPMPRVYRSAAEGSEVAGQVRAVGPWLAGRAAGILPRAVQRRYDDFRRQVARLGARWRILSPPAGGPGAPPGGPAKPPPAKGQR